MKNKSDEKLLREIRQLKRKIQLLEIENHNYKKTNMILTNDKERLQEKIELIDRFYEK